MIASKAKKSGSKKGGPQGPPMVGESLFDGAHRHVPDVPGVVPDGAVGGEDAGSGDVHQGHLVPPLGVAVGQARPDMGVPVALEVGQQQVLVGHAAVAEEQPAGDVLIGHAVAEAHIELKASLSNYEREDQQPKKATWQILADFFNVNLSYIMGLSSTRNKVDEHLYKTTISRLVELTSGNYKNASKIRKIVRSLTLLLEETKNNEKYLGYLDKLITSITTINPYPKSCPETAIP